MNVIDLNAERTARAARREGAGGPIRVPLGNETFELPEELPTSIIDRLLDPEVEIAQLLLIAARSLKENRDDKSLEIIVDTLSVHPDLPLGFARAVLGAIEDLFGPEQWQRFRAAKPSVPDMFALVRGLIKAYGVALGEALTSSAVSGSGGATSKPTSGVSTDSTPAESGPDQAPPASLASGG